MVSVIRTQLIFENIGSDQKYVITSTVCRSQSQIGFFLRGDLFSMMRAQHELPSNISTMVQYANPSKHKYYSLLLSLLSKIFSKLLNVTDQNNQESFSSMKQTSILDIH